MTRYRQTRAGLRSAGAPLGLCSRRRVEDGKPRPMACRTWTGRGSFEVPSIERTRFLRRRRKAPTSGGWWALSVVPLALVLLILASCGVATRTTSDSRSAHPQDELPVDDARSIGLTRKDAVSIVGPTQVHTAGKSTPFRIRVVVPSMRDTPRLPGATTPGAPQAVDIDFHGSCLLAGALHPRGLLLASEVGPNSNSRADASNPAGAETDSMSVEAVVTVMVPTGSKLCDVVVDAWVTGRPYSGNDLRTIFRA
jgi:hypothetical protein